jgi:hypothetical protein
LLGFDLEAEKPLPAVGFLGFLVWPADLFFGDFLLKFVVKLELSRMSMLHD